MISDLITTNKSVGRVRECISVGMTNIFYQASHDLTSGVSVGEGYVIVIVSEGRQLNRYLGGAWTQI